jgi:hypothetical protein
LFRTADGELPLQINPKANIPLVLFPTAEPRKVVELDAATPHAVLEHVAYVYLFRVVEWPVGLFKPKANIPLVLLPAADPA